MPITLDLATHLLNSVSLPAYVADTTFWAVPAALAAFRITEPSREPGCILTINGVPQHVILARLNAKKNAPQGKKRKQPPKALGKKGELRKEADRADLKAVLRQHAQEDHQIQQRYEVEFKRQKRWSWNRVAREARKEGVKLTAAGLAILAAAAGIIVDLPVFA